MNVKLAHSCYRLCSVQKIVAGCQRSQLRTLLSYPLSRTQSTSDRSNIRVGAVQHTTFVTTRRYHTSKISRMPVEGYTTEERGESNTDTYKVFVKDSEGPISPFHDIPLNAAEPGAFHMVVEVPRWTNAKMELDTTSPLNPIVQDQKKGKLRFVANSFPHHGYIWNYGAFPQTWENPNHKDESTQCMGDNDPVDCCEIGHRVAKRGDVLAVKCLGTLAMIDDGEADWKMIVIDVNDPLAAELNNLEDVERVMPGFLDTTREWFRIYKIPDGKPENKFAFDGEFQDAEFANKIISETHEYWKHLVGLSDEKEDKGKLDISCVKVEGASTCLSRDDAAGILAATGEYIVGVEPATSVDTWHYAHLKK